MADTNYTYKIKKTQGITPVFVAKAVAGNPSQVEFFCPYCTKYHRHGAAGGDFEGHRTAHCLGETPLSKTGYYLIAEKRSRSKILQR
jgi:hypothetical protein